MRREPVQTRVPKEIADVLRKRAKASDRSVSAEVLSIVKARLVEDGELEPEALAA